MSWGAELHSVIKTWIYDGKISSPVFNSLLSNIFLAFLTAVISWEKIAEGFNWWTRSCGFHFQIQHSLSIPRSITLHLCLQLHVVQPLLNFTRSFWSPSPWVCILTTQKSLTFPPEAQKHPGWINPSFENWLLGLNLLSVRKPFSVHKWNFLLLLFFSNAETNSANLESSCQLLTG